VFDYEEVYGHKKTYVARQPVAPVQVVEQKKEVVVPLVEESAPVQKSAPNSYAGIVKRPFVQPVAQAPKEKETVAVVVASSEKKDANKKCAREISEIIKQELSGVAVGVAKRAILSLGKLNGDSTSKTVVATQAVAQDAVVATQAVAQDAVVTTGSSKGRAKSAEWGDDDAWN
jgi:hypothetical protein